MKQPTGKQIPLTLDLRNRLKSIVEAELESLPERLEYLQDKKRLDIVLKLLPFVIPKSKPVTHRAGEAGDWPSIV